MHLRDFFFKIIDECQSFNLVLKVFIDYRKHSQKYRTCMSHPNRKYELISNLKTNKYYSTTEIIDL